jgi:hypothetical protein
MGNQSSQPASSTQSLEYVINHTISNYIRSQNFIDMKNLSKLEYCDKLVVLTSKIINQYLDDTTIKYLAQKKGILGEKLVKEQVLAIDKDQLDNLDIKNTVKKRRICIGLAKHYVQIANLFAAIASTINPKFNIEDNSGNITSVDLKDKSDIPDDVPIKITKSSLCSRRVASLLNNQDLQTLEEQIKSGTVEINPDFCSITCNNCPDIKNLAEEPGIPELERLYYDKYDYDTGEFDKMTDTMKTLYKSDVDELYKIFTGNDSVPETVTKFSDIKLKDYYQTSGCEDGTYSLPVKGTAINYQFYQYIDNIKSMMESTKGYHDKLLKILDQLFSFDLNPDTKEVTVVINPNITDVLLKSLTNQTILIISNLYASCERKFTKGINIYTSIAKKQLLKTSSAQIKNLNQVQDELLNPETANVPDTVVEPDPNTLETDPNTEKSDPNIKKSDPNTLETDPATIETDPDIKETDPATIETDLNTMETDPATIETDPNTEKSDPNTEKSDPDTIETDPDTVEPKTSIPRVTIEEEPSDSIKLLETLDKLQIKETNNLEEREKADLAKLISQDPTIFDTAQTATPSKVVPIDLENRIKKETDTVGRSNKPLITLPTQP